VETAQGFGLGEYHGLACAYAIRGRAADDTADARADARHAIVLARRASTDLALSNVLCISGDTRTVIDRCSDPGIVGRHLTRAESRHRLVTPRPRSSALIEQLTDRKAAVQAARDHDLL